MIDNEWKTRLGGALLLLSVGCSIGQTPPPPPPPPSAELAAGTEAERAVRGEIQRYYQSFSARDWVAFADHFWPGATLTTVWPPAGQPGAKVDAQTVPSFVSKAPEGPDSKPIFEERMTDATIRVYGNLAQAWVHYAARFGDSTEVMEWQGIDAFTLLELDGRWKISSIGFTNLDGEP